MINKVKIFKVFLCPIIIIFCLIEVCNAQPFSVKSQDLVASTITKEQAINIFKDIVRILPINCLTTKIDNKECIICLANKTGVEGKNKMLYSNANIFLYKLTKFADVWRVEMKKEIFSEEFTYYEFYNDFEIAMIGNYPYLYFLYSQSPMGNAVSYLSLSFSLISLKDFKLTTLDYGGDPVYDKNTKLKNIKGDFSNLDELTSKPNILKYLEGKASKSSIIYRANKQDLDMNNVNNYDKKWQLDNSKIKSVWDTNENTSYEPLRVTYYDKNIFSTETGSVNEIIENNIFKIASFFRGNILGYDKTKRKYFPIWIESCARGCDKTIKFKNDTTLQITYSESDDQKIIVDLTQMAYKLILK
jgi:hypothetical protein